jgi:3-methyl-2-oxobutanoate hydroxymethyltransferase
VRTTISDLHRMKQTGDRIVMLTAYDTSAALIAERAGVRVLLVGDSLGMVVHGHSTTIPVTLEDMIRHAAAVSRGSREALLVADLPFLSYGTEADAIAAARRLMQEGQVHAVKLEGGQPMDAIIARLTACGVPVMGHLGFTPQAQHQIGLRVQGKDVAGARRLVQDALAIETAGAFAVVLELVPAPLAAAISRRLRIPAIGIGAGPGCDGEVQVWHDVLGLFDGKALRHTKRYAEIGVAMTEAIRAYAADVRTRTFPGQTRSSEMDAEILAEALRDL